MDPSKKDMENIQKNLEHFLEQEIKGTKETGGPAYENASERNRNPINIEEAGDDLLPERDGNALEEKEPSETESSLWKKRQPEEKIHGIKKENRKRKRKPEKKKQKDKGREKKKEIKKKEYKENKIERIEKKERKEEKAKRGEDLSRKNKKRREYEEEEEVKKSGLGRFLALFICFLVLLGIAWYAGISGIYGKMEYNEEGQLAEESMKDRGVIHILLIGTDARSSEEAGRSDAMILLSISPNTKTVHMTSLLRDMYVEIPGHDGNRLNAAYAFGGPELLLETVSLNLGIDVNRYVVVDFQTFANLVDAVGGVDLELTNEEVQWVNAYLNEYNLLRNMPIETDYLDPSLSGTLHLNGPQALAYCRNRYIGSDFGRTERQRKVLGAVADNASSAIISNPMGLIDGVFSELTTNLTKSECLRLSLMGGKLLTYDIVQGSIPLSGTYRDVSIRGMAVLEVDFEKNKEYIKTEIYGE